MKYRILPIFIPQYCCPFQCIFCDQKIISGEKEEITLKRIERQIIDGISLNDGNELEIAFYGGNFTAIPIEVQRKFLELACGLKNIRSIRISTRPDYINDEILQFLKEYNVKTIEIGIQSMFDDVLEKANRGHNSEDNINAMKLIKSHGFLLGAQVMIGLPGSNSNKDIETAKIVCEYKPDFARIYPTLVIKNTALERFYKNGEYKPLGLEDAILISATIKEIFINNGIKVIRVGLQPTKEINYNAEVLAGPFHPSFGELVDSEIIFRRIISVLSPSFNMGDITIYVHPKYYSKLVGHKKQILNRLSEIYYPSKVNISVQTTHPSAIKIISEDKEYSIDVKDL